MNNRRFTDAMTNAYYGFESIQLFAYRVDKYNVAAYYYAATIGSKLSPTHRPPFLVEIRTLGRYPQMVKSERFTTFKDLLHWLIEEFRPEYYTEEESEALYQEALLEMELEGDC